MKAEGDIIDSYFKNKDLAASKKFLARSIISARDLLKDIKNLDLDKASVLDICKYVEEHDNHKE